MVESNHHDKSSSLSQLHQDFLALEQTCLGYEDYVNANEESYLKTIGELRELVVTIQRESIFSDNEDIKEIDTDSLKYIIY